jgi:hypothetical protein
MATTQQYLASYALSPPPLDFIFKRQKSIAGRSQEQESQEQSDDQNRYFITFIIGCLMDPTVLILNYPGLRGEQRHVVIEARLGLMFLLPTVSGRIVDRFGRNNSPRHEHSAPPVTMMRWARLL